MRLSKTLDDILKPINLLSNAIPFGSTYISAFLIAPKSFISFPIGYATGLTLQSIAIGYTTYTLTKDPKITSIATITSLIAPPTLFVTNIVTSIWKSLSEYDSNNPKNF